MTWQGWPPALVIEVGVKAWETRDSELAIRARARWALMLSEWRALHTDLGAPGSGGEVRDCQGTPLAAGCQVDAWFDGVQYTATVKAVAPHHPGCGDHRHLILTRHDGTETGSFSDAVRVRTDRSGPARP